MTTGSFIREYSVRFNALCLECLDLVVEGLLTGRHTGVAEKSHGWKCLLNQLVEIAVYYVPFDDLIDTPTRGI